MKIKALIAVILCLSVVAAMGCGCSGGTEETTSPGTSDVSGVSATDKANGNKSTEPASDNTAKPHKEDVTEEKSTEPASETAATTEPDKAGVTEEKSTEPASETAVATSDVSQVGATHKESGEVSATKVTGTADETTSTQGETESQGVQPVQQVEIVTNSSGIDLEATGMVVTEIEISERTVDSTLVKQTSLGKLKLQKAKEKLDGEEKDILTVNYKVDKKTVNVFFSIVTMGEGDKSSVVMPKLFTRHSGDATFLENYRTAEGRVVPLKITIDF